MRFRIINHIGENSIAAHIATHNITDEILSLCENLPAQSQSLLLRQIARMRESHLLQNPIITNITQDEFIELEAIATQFFPNIFKLSENLYFYSDTSHKDSTNHAGYFLPINHFEISVFWHKHSLKHLDSATLAKMRGKDFIDVGGFIGDSAIVFEREFCDKNIYSFEPTRANFELMKRTIELNNAKRIIPLNLGLGSEKSQMQISILGSGSSIALDCGGEKESVEITTLDSFVKERQIEVGFIKVDVEGFEMEFLKGAKETIRHQKPAMLISIYHQASDYFEIKPLIESWDLGYKLQVCKGVDFSLVAETVLLCEVCE